MAPSQLKRLKSSLRERGVIGPQKSKKQKRKLAQDGQGRIEKRLQRTAALESIREQFNPFELKHSARGPKFDVTTNKPQSSAVTKGIKGQPGVSKAIGEERVSCEYLQFAKTPWY
jgi:nucleolar protein 14